MGPEKIGPEKRSPLESWIGAWVQYRIAMRFGAALDSIQRSSSRFFACAVGARLQSIRDGRLDLRTPPLLCSARRELRGNAAGECALKNACCS